MKIPSKIAYAFLFINIFPRFCHAQTMMLSPKTVDLAYVQGNENCPSVAITKWVIATYGFKPTSGLFSAKTNADQSISISLADGRTTTVTMEQIAIAADHASFNPPILTDQSSPTPADRQQIVARANLIYAALAVLKSGRSLDGHKIDEPLFTKYVKQLDHGGVIDNLYALLGFELVDQVEFPDSIPNIYGSAVHVVFAMNTNTKQYDQNLYDEHGRFASIADYDYSNGRNGHRWRYALASAATTSSSIPSVTRQCERTPGIWDACTDFDY